jgi:hypothetical protein
MDKKNERFLKEIEEVEENKELYISFISFLLEEFQKNKEEVNYEKSGCIL